MIETDSGSIHIEGYIFTAGKKIDPPYRKLATHTHTRVRKSDGIISPEAQFAYAVEQGWDLMPTDHNTLEGFERMLREKENNGYKDCEGILIPAYEHTVIDGITGKHTHIIFIGSDRVLSPHLTEEEALTQAHQLGWITVAPHPGLGTYSVSLAGVEKRNTNKENPEGTYNLIEIYNAGAQKGFQAVQKATQLPVIGWLAQTIAPHIASLPHYDTNHKAEDFFINRGEELGLKLFAGSDAHAKEDIGDVLIVRAAELDPADALKNGEIAIYIRDPLTPFTAAMYLKKHFFNIKGEIFA